MIEQAKDTTEVSFLSGRSTRFIAAGTLANLVTVSPAVHAVYGTFLIPLTSEFGWTRAQFSIGLGIVSVTGAIGYPAVGLLADRLRAPMILLLGFALFAASLASMAFLTSSLSQLYLSFFCIGVSATLASTTLLSRIVAQAFDKNRGLALAITSGVGNAAGCVLIPTLAAVLLSHSGWRTAYAGVAVTVAVAGLSASLILMRYGNSARTRATVGLAEPGCWRAPASPISRVWRFAVLLASIGGGAGISMVVFSHVVPIMASNGIGLSVATIAIGVFAVVGAVAQVGAGAVLDRTRSPRVIAVVCILASPSLLVLGLDRSASGVLVGCGALGIATAVQFAALPYLVTKYYSPRNAGVLTGLLYSAVVIAQGVGPFILDKSYDILRSYGPATIVGAGVYLLLGLLLLLLPRYTSVQQCLPRSP